MSTPSVAEDVLRASCHSPLPETDITLVGHPATIEAHGNQAEFKDVRAFIQTTSCGLENHRHRLRRAAHVLRVVGLDAL